MGSPALTLATLVEFLEALQLFDDMKSKQLEVATEERRGGKRGESSLCILLFAEETKA